jgi:hypothetical protein
MASVMASTVGRGVLVPKIDSAYTSDAVSSCDSCSAASTATSGSDINAPVGGGTRQAPCTLALTYVR